MQMSAEGKVVEFVPLLNHDDYEILNIHPFTIRRKSNHYEVKESDRGNGYIRVKLNRRDYLKHRLIAEQFIPNPLNLPDVDHRNHDRTDYHLSNLFWVSKSTNNYNRSSINGVVYEFYDDIPDESIRITDYRTTNRLYEFDYDKYYYDEINDVFYMKIDKNYYKKMHVNVDKKELAFINCMDINNRRVLVYINKFKRQYDLIQ